MPLLAMINQLECNVDRVFFLMNANNVNHSLFHVLLDKLGYAILTLAITDVVGSNVAIWIFKVVTFTKFVEPFAMDIKGSRFVPNQSSNLEEHFLKQNGHYKEYQAIKGLFLSVIKVNFYQSKNPLDRSHKWFYRPYEIAWPPLDIGLFNMRVPLAK